MPTRSTASHLSKSTYCWFCETADDQSQSRGSGLHALICWSEPKRSGSPKSRQHPRPALGLSVQRGATRDLAYGESSGWGALVCAPPPQTLIVRLGPSGVNDDRQRLNRLSERTLSKIDDDPEGCLMARSGSITNFRKDGEQTFVCQILRQI
jgi:hypothetical protein